jgi:hypothetical protein
MATFAQQASLHGISLAAGGFLQESFNDTLTAHAGGGQTGALQLYAEVSRVTTVASVGDSVVLPSSASVALYADGPTSSGGLTLLVINHGANAMQVFGAGTDTIDDVAYATGVSQMAGSVTLYVCTTPGAWYSNGIGTGYSGQYPTVSWANGLSTAGTTQSGATPTTACINRFTTVGSAGGAAVLPAAAAGMQITVNNAAASNSMNLFPNGTDAINALGASTALAIPAGKTAFLTSAVAGQWHCQAPS